ncbi:RHS repeat-associated core domain-containing protein, partial [Weeksellaceae bacterium A-14]
LILTQDFLMRPEKQWLFTKYDQYGRVIYTGITADPGTRSGIQGYVDLHFPQNNEGSGEFTANGLTVKYSKDQAFPTYINTLLSVNYYDTYPDAGSDFPDLSGNDSYGQKYLEANLTGAFSTKGLPTASFVKNIDSDKWTKTYTYYDRKGRVIYTYTKNYLGGYTKTGSKLDFTGQVLATFTRHKRSSDNLPAEVYITERFVYDSQNRLLKHYHNVNNTGYDVVLADNTYDELGRLVIKKSGAEVNAGTDTQSKAPLQSISYVYNIRGWLNGINLKNVNGVLQLDSDKLFSYRIRYEDSEISSLRKYNGNISETQWSYGTATSQKYQYHYDALNRL